MACNGPEVEGGRGWKLHVDELIRHRVRASHVKTVASSLSIYPWLYVLLSLSLSRRKIMHSFLRIPWTETGEGQKGARVKKGEEGSGRVARAHVLL